MSTLTKSDTVFDVRLASPARAVLDSAGKPLTSLAAKSGWVGSTLRWPDLIPPRSPRWPAARVDGAAAPDLAGLDIGPQAGESPSRHPDDRGSAGLVASGADELARPEGAEGLAAPGPAQFKGVLEPLLAQAPVLSSSDASTSVRVTDMPPWSLVAGGLAFGAALAGGGGGSGGPVIQQVIWSGTNFSASAASGVTVLVNAAAAVDGGVLTLSGAGAATVEGLKAGVTIDASALSGALIIRVADDGRATPITVITGAGATTVAAGDFRDTITLTADRLPDGGSLTVGGSSNVNITGLVADLDASGLSAGLLSVSTSSTAPGVVPKSSGGARDIDIRLGVDEARVTALYTGDTVRVDAESLSDGNLLRTAGSGAFEIRNLSGDLFNLATGTVSVTLDNDRASVIALGSSITSLAGATTVTVNNGSLDDNDSIVLTGTDRFIVNGLLANLDAMNTTAALTITTADAGDNLIAIVTGSNSASVAGIAASDAILVNAASTLDGMTLTLSGASAFTVTGLSADIDARTATGALTVSTPSDAFGSAIDIAIGVGGASITASDVFDLVAVDADRMSADSTLTTAGLGSVQITGMSGTLINSARGSPVSVVLDNDAIAGARQVTVSSTALITVANGTLDHDDTIRLSGVGPFNVTGLRADLDGHRVAGEIMLATGVAGAGDDHVIGVSTGSAATSIDAQVAADQIKVDAAALQDGLLLRLLGASSFEVRNLTGDLTRSTTGPVKAYVRAGSTTSVLTSALGNLEVAAEPASLGPGADTVNLDVLGIADDVSLRASGAGNFSIDNLRADLDAASVTGKLSVALVAPSGAVGALKNQNVVTGSGDDLLRYGANTLDASSTGVSLDLGGGFNVVSVDNGAEWVTGAKVVTLSASGLSELRLADGARVTLSSLHLVNPNSWDPSAPVSDPFDSLTQAGAQSGTVETIAVSTTASVLRAGTALVPAAFVLDADIEKWEIGLIGHGNNIVALGAGTQSVSLGTGNDTLALNGVSASGVLQGLETLDVRAGGGIAQAILNSGTAGAGQSPGSIIGTRIDFADISASLGLSLVQHDAIRDNALLVAAGADSGTQTLRLSTGGAVSNQVAGIEAYELSGTSGGTPISLTLDGAAGPTVINDFTQSGSDLRSVKGGSGSDAVHSSAIDLSRGLLSVDLSAGGSDYLFIQNAAIGNEGLTGAAAKAGFGGSIVELSPGAGYSNPTTFSATQAAWNALDKNDPALSLGIRAETITGFTPGSGSGADKLVYLSGAADVTFQRFITFQQAAGVWDYSQAPVSNSVIEIDAEFAASQPDLTLGSDPRALDKVAGLLARMSSLKPFTDQGGDKYYVIVYADQTATSDAWLYAATATENDGFDFVDNVSAVPDTDTLELIGIFKSIGASGFAAANFV